MSTRGILIDLDGTLVDSSDGIYSSFCHAISSFGFALPRKDEFKNMIGPPVATIVDRLYPGLSSECIDSIVSSFRSHYDSEGFLDFCIYEGVRETLQRMSRIVDKQLAVVTNKPSSPAFRILEAAGLDTCFSIVVGIDYKELAKTGHKFSSKCDAIRFTVDLMGWDISESMYIGDTTIDKQECLAASIPFVAATYGFGKWEEDELRTCLEISSFAYILDHL